MLEWLSLGSKSIPLNEARFLTEFTGWTGLIGYLCNIALVYGFKPNPENRENHVNPVKTELAHGHWARGDPKDA